MSLHLRWAGALALAVCTLARARADEAPAPALRWSDVAAALDRDPRLTAALADVRAAEGGLAAARTPPNPSLEASAGRGRAQDGTARRDEWGLAVTLPLEWLARRGPEVAAARAAVDGAAAEARALRAEVAAELWRLHVRAGYAQAEVDALEATERQAEALARLVRRRVEAGEGRPVELPRVELELERVRGEVAAARGEREGALAQLGAWLRAPIRRVERPAPPAIEAVADPAGVAGHARVQAARARAEAARAAAAAARRARLPGVAIGAFYASELDRRSVGGRIAIELPLWDWKAGPVRRAEAVAAAEASRAEAEGRALAAALAEASAVCDRAGAVAERQEGRVLPRAEEAARTLERTFQLGEVGLLDVIDARRALLQARRDLLAAARERDLACGALVLLSGRELP